MDFVIGNIRGLIGMAAFLGLCYLLSTNRKAIDWKLVRTGMLFQIVFAFFVFFTPMSELLKWFSGGFVYIIEKTNEATSFLIGDAVMGLGFSFAFNVLPTIIVFSVISSFLYYIGVLQKVVYGLAWVLNKTMRLSGAESLAAAANVFLGQTEAPLIVRPYLEKMTRSEILCLMTGGMATIAGGVFAAYMQILGGDATLLAAQIAEGQAILGDNPRHLAAMHEILGSVQMSASEILGIDAKKFAEAVIADRRVEFGKHLFTASFISAPAAIVSAKMLFPEDQPDKINKDMTVPKDKIGSNMLEALSIGTTEGLKLAVNVGAMLLAFTAIIYILNGMLLSIGGIGGDYCLNNLVNNAFPLLDEAGNRTINPETGEVIGKFGGFKIEFILGGLLSPIAWLLGVDWSDTMTIGQLLGKKTILNEFIAYDALSKEIGTLSEKSVRIATYALCGFANFASIGIQIGGIGQLAPTQRSTLSRFGLLALVGGTVACFFTACIAGILYEWTPVCTPMAEMLDELILQDWLISIFKFIGFIGLIALFYSVYKTEKANKLT